MKTGVSIVLIVVFYSCGINTLPEPSMENELLVGDYLFIDKETKDSRMPDTLLDKLSYPLINNELNEKQSNLNDTLKTSSTLNSEITNQRNDVIVFDKHK